MVNYDHYPYEMAIIIGNIAYFQTKPYHPVEEIPSGYVKIAIENGDW